MSEPDGYYYCEECGKVRLLRPCSCTEDPRDYNPESDPKRYYQGEDEE